jgi:hypothetical protein
MISAPASAFPFGAPDAANEASSPSRYSTAASSVVGPKIRVMVGRMGAGKTRYLVELRQQLKSSGGCQLTPTDFDLPSLVHVTRLAEDLALEPVERAEIWSKLWRRAIVRSALSHMLWEQPGGFARLPAMPAHLVPPNSVPHSIYADFGRILSDHQTVTQLRVFLDDSEWETVDYCFRELLEGRRTPLCFFLDTVEEDSSHAPRYWLWCQLGLVRQVLQLAHDELLADRLRIFVAIRDQTWAELLKAAKPSMYAQHPKVLQLRWGPGAAALFLSEKIRALPPEYMLGECTGTDPRSFLKAWLGTDRVTNGRNDGERLLLYLLRHTRLIPRDIVSVGNLLSVEVLAARGRDDPNVPAECIVNAVAESARLSAREELQACALEVIAKRLAGAGSAADRRRIVPDEDAASRTLEATKELLGRCGTQVVPRARLDEVDAEASARFNVEISLSELLWRRGLLGWSAGEPGPYEFPYGSPNPQPARGGFVAIHPCLVDELALEPARGAPVVPFVESDLP